MRARRQTIPDAESFRRKTKTALQQVERDAIAGGYHSEDIRDTHFAVVAFLDEVVLNSNDPVRVEWERQTLQEELSGKTEAGLVFFEKLESFLARRDSQHLADLLEIYLLCMLLGFQGRYSAAPGELDALVERARKRIDRIRGRSARLSPGGDLPPERQAVETVATKARYTRPEAIAAYVVVVAIVLFLILKLSLISGTQEVSRGLT